MQLNYEYARLRGFRLHECPRVEAELGLVPRVQMAVEMPLQRVRNPGEPATWTAGHLGIALRYLVAGGEQRSFAMSVNPFVVAPTGNRSITGEAIETGALLHVDKEFAERVLFHGNYGYALTVGGNEERERAFVFRSAVVLPFTKRWNPVLELLGETDVKTGQTQLVLQPEMIYYVNNHWELKLGIPLGTTSTSPTVGLRVQVAWIFGRHGSD